VNFLLNKINLHYSAVKEVRPDQPVNRRLARPAQVVQIECQKICRKRNFVESGVGVDRPEALVRVLNAPHHDAVPGFEAKARHGARVDDADAGAGIEQEIEGLVRLRYLDLDPNKALAKLEWNFGGCSRFPATPGRRQRHNEQD